MTRQLLSIYARIARTYTEWARLLLPVAAIVFVPLGLLGAIPLDADLESLDFGSGLALVGVAAAAAAIAGTALIGEVFYSGAVAVALTHRRNGGPPSLREISRQIAYPRLIAVDLIYGLLVLVGLALLVVPGVALYVWLGLAGPVVEIERRGVLAALARSRQLVRGRFWMVLAVLAPIELVGEGIGALAAALGERAVGDSLAVEWLAESLSNILVTPFFAVAAVLLTVDLIAAKDGREPRLHSAPSRA